MGHQRKLGSYGKNRIFWPKTEILGPKKGSHFCRQCPIDGEMAGFDALIIRLFDYSKPASFFF